MSFSISADLFTYLLCWLQIFMQEDYSKTSYEATAWLNAAERASVSQIVPNIP